MKKAIILTVENRTMEDVYSKYIVLYTDGKKVTERTYEFYIPNTVKKFIESAQKEIIEDCHVGPLRYTVTKYKIRRARQ